jgi:predicted ATPase
MWQVEIARLLPELLAPASVQPQPPTDNWQRQHLLEALARAVLGDEQPLLLLFDDLQWCDHETLHWLRYLLHLAPQARLLVVGTVRPEEVDRAHPLGVLETDLRRSGQFIEIALPALNEAEVSALAGHLRDTRFTSHELAQLYRETEGNPLFVVETVRSGLPLKAQSHPRGHAAASFSTLYSTPPARLPPKVYTVIRSRLMQLSAAAQELVSLAAVVGRSFTFDILAATGSQDEETLVNSLDEL